ncbi:ATP-dependent DNA helicase [Candidatus Poriferisocius sp.]|uniref:ATP-dependent DNA helicase n=1 Tax=Candidatus Poriferisocius sp. TaxID=3101276 RepID=UPI003B52A13E
MPEIAAVEEALELAISALEDGGERRPGQRKMCQAVAETMESGRHLVVAAGTGTGKSLAYLVPLVLGEGPSVVATATKTLQDQLVDKDLPQLAAALDLSVRFAVLKGRSNYLCLQRLKEHADDEQLSLAIAEGPRVEINRLAAWAQQTDTGDRAELEFEPSPAAWDALSVSGRECPGAQRCPSGPVCFAEKARHRADAADIVVVNTHLYCLHLFSDTPILPEHDTVVIDEAHGLEDIVSDTAGLSLTGGRFDELARSIRAVVAESAVAGDLEDAGMRLREALAPFRDKPLPAPLPGELQRVAVVARGRVEQAAVELRAVPDGAPGDVAPRKLRAILSAGALAEDLNRAVEAKPSEVAWVSGTEAAPAWRIAPIQLGDLLRQRLWDHTTAVLTSATIPMNLGEVLGLEPDEHRAIDVGSPFDFEANGLLYCAKHLPDPRNPGYEPAVHEELAALIEAAGGRTLALFTSYRAMDRAAEVLRAQLDFEIYSQRDLPKPELLRRFAAEVESCLFATMSFWQGVDVPGESLSLVTIDRLPFPRPDDPLLEARRERYGSEAFRLVDLPRAATRLAQGAGRLIRRGNDRGVVAVLDSRMAKAGYRWELVRSLPPFPRTAERDRAVTLLRMIRDGV